MVKTDQFTTKCNGDSKYHFLNSSAKSSGKNGGCEILNALLLLLKIVSHFFITGAFTLSYDSPHDFSGKGVLTDLNGVLPK